jgi:hypothetical protein
MMQTIYSNAKPILERDTMFVVHSEYKDRQGRTAYRRRASTNEAVSLNTLNSVNFPSRTETINVQTLSRMAVL